MKIHKFIQFYILFSVAQYICDFHLKNIFKTLFLKDTVIHTNHFCLCVWTVNSLPSHLQFFKPPNILPKLKTSFSYQNCNFTPKDL